jgi:hypothetical protein
LRDDLYYEHVYDPFLPSYNRTEFGAGDWAVVLNASAVYDGADVETLLQTIPDAEVQRMQARLRALAPRIQYSHGNTGTDARSILREIIRALPTTTTTTTLPRVAQATTQTGVSDVHEIPDRKSASEYEQLLKSTLSPPARPKTNLKNSNPWASKRGG